MECCGEGEGLAVAKRLRWVLNQAAQTAKRSPDFAATYAAIAKRRGKKIATIAIARKLLTRAYHLLASMQATDTSTPAASAASAAAAPKTGRSPSSGHARPLRHEPGRQGPRSIF
jgi:hypothetical protein